MGYFVRHPEHLAAFRAGAPDVLTEVFNHYVDGVTRLLRHGFRLGSGTVFGVGDAERELELVQETFLRAFSPSSRCAYQPRLPYLFRIAKNLLLDELRRRRATVVTEISEDELEQAPLLEPTADEELEWRTLRAATQEYCRVLPAELAELTRARFEAGLSQRDAATALGITRRRVRTLEQQVLDGLKLHLTAQGLLDEGDRARPISLLPRMELE
jgi:RNA polymerase sigma factor (sigma-70 family)